MFTGQTNTDSLTPLEQQAIHASCDALIDNSFADIPKVKGPEDIARTLLGSHLPRRYTYRYTPEFLRKLASGLVTTEWKLTQPAPPQPLSLAEELTVWIILQEARKHLVTATNEKGQKPFDAFTNNYFANSAIKYLYDRSYDGIEEAKLVQITGISALAFDNWFAPLPSKPYEPPQKQEPPRKHRR